MKVQYALLAMTCALAVAAAPARAAIDDAKAQQLMATGGCNICHAVDKKLIGPAFKEIAAKRKGEADAVATLLKTVRAGSKGTYGPMPMPPNPAGKLDDAALHDLLEWVLTK